jgi:hypothetical protein
VPTSSGPAVPGGHTRAPLSKRVAKRLGTGAEGKELRDVASASAYGAPQKKLHSSKRAAAEARSAVAKPSPAVSGATVNAAVDAVGAGRSVVVWLVLALLLTTALGVGTAVARARR